MPEARSPAGERATREQSFHSPAGGEARSFHEGWREKHRLSSETQDGPKFAEAQTEEGHFWQRRFYDFKRLE